MILGFLLYSFKQKVYIKIRLNPFESTRMMGLNKDRLLLDY